MNNRARFFFKTIFFLVLVCMGVTGGVVFLLFKSDGAKEVRDLLVRRGTTMAQVSQELHKQEVIQYPKLFRYVLRLTGGASKMRAGEFRFKKDMRMIDALFVLYYDEPIVHQITIPEGWNVRQVAQIVAAAKLVDEKRFLEQAFNPDVVKRLGIKGPSVEGYLFPDTYAFSRVDGEDRILERMVQRFRQKFAKDYEAEIKEKGWTMERLVIMASMIEKETGAAKERPIISSVFHNRMKKHMRMQSDPTTIYGIPNFNGNLTRADLLRPSPYNTYTIAELPIGPISNPGFDALVSALRPATTNYLYFVSNNNGEHIFSETYGQHAGHVNNYQKNGATRRASSKQIARDKNGAKKR